jgi:hypothetical protein
MRHKAYSPIHDAPSTKTDAKRASGSEVTAFQVHEQGQCICPCARTDFFRKWGRGGRGPGASPGVPNPPPGPPRRVAAQGGKGELCTALKFPGVCIRCPRVRVRKCHLPPNITKIQKSTSNSAGSSVGSLAPPRAALRLGGVYVSCQYFPCSFVQFVLALRELGLRLSIGGQSPTPTPAPRQLPWGPPRGWRSGRLAYSNWGQFAISSHGPKSRSRGTMHHALRTAHCAATTPPPPHYALRTTHYALRTTR